MKSYLEIVKTIWSRDWTLLKLSQALCLSESTITVALQNPADKNIRQKIAQKVGVSYPELFGEEMGAAR